MAVAFDAKASAIYNGTVSSGGQLNFTNHTVGVGSNRALEVSIIFLTSDPGTVTVIWDPGGANQSLTLIDSYVDSTNFSNKPVRLDKWGLAAPVSGNKTLQLNCSAGRFTAIMNTVSVTGANQGGGIGTFRNATHAEDITGASNIASVTVTSDTSSLIIAQYYAELSNTFGSLSNNSVYTATNSTAAAAENYAAGFPSVTLTGALTAFGKWMAQGVSIAAPGGLSTDGAVLGGASALVASSNQIYSNAASLNAAAVLIAAASQRMVSKAQLGGSGSLFTFATILGAPIQWSGAALLSSAASLAVASSRLILTSGVMQMAAGGSLSAACFILQIPKITHSDPSYTGVNAGDEIMVTSGLNDSHVISMDSGTLLARASPGHGPPDYITMVPPLILTQQGLTLDPSIQAQLTALAVSGVIGPAGPIGPTGAAGPVGPTGAIGPTGSGGSGGMASLGRLNIPSTSGIPLTTLNFQTTDGANWVRSTDSTQPTYTVDADGHGWMLDQSTGYAKLAWFKNASAMATADWNTTALTGTDNAVAFLEMNAFGRKVCAAGKRFVLDATANHANNCWGFNYSNCVTAMVNLTQFTLEGGGASFQNIQGLGISSDYYSSWFYSAFSNANVASANTPKAYFPLSTNAEPGDTTVTLATAADTSYFNVGDWILVASFSTQYSGYPHNWDRFDYVKITSKGTGTLTFVPALKNEHRTDFPDDGTAAQFPGAAKVVMLNSPVGALYHPTGLSVTATWDCDQLFRNMTVLLAVNTTYTQSTFNCRKVRLENCTWVGNSESLCMDFSTYRTTFTTSPEPDKIVGRVHHSQSYWPQGMTFQSASIQSVIMDDCVVEGTTGLKVAGRNVQINGGSFSNLNFGVDALGCTRSVVINGVTALNYLEPSLYPGTTLSVDGTNVTYANGTIKCPKSYGAGLGNLLRCVPGSYMYWEPNTASGYGVHGFPGNFGLMIVIKVYQDATFVYYDTTCPFASVPSWGSGNVFLLGMQSVLVSGSTGCDQIRRASEACKRGLANSLFKMTYAGAFPQSGNLQQAIVGAVTQISINVLKSTTTPSNAYLEITMPLYSATAPTTRLGSGGGDFRFHVDLTVAGLRTATTTAASLLGNDILQDNNTGTPYPTIFPNALIGPNGISWFANFTPSSSTNFQLPVVDVEIQTNVGMLGSPLSSGIAAKIVGQLP